MESSNRKKADTVRNSMIIVVNAMIASEADLGEIE
jgi:hypothetical protein